MIEINLFQVKDTEQIRAALAQATGLPVSVILEAGAYWAVDSFDDVIGFELVSDNVWNLLVVHTTNDSLEEDAVSITKELARSLQEPCAVFDPHVATEDVLRIFYPDGRDVMGCLRQEDGRTTIEPVPIDMS
ncbi:hypothetical protein So717_26510 [Roseobacter cerasinus]|uniref:Uncharacterized protein n=1 Tax=Roseobacter cerasinus TaxID=2602289 RepID=A0A640VR69_9RHOB|nr:hypothetical protein [Roseobacter cerasinus]GFE50898.1 hypothetical protein So717_26510 [Roseobacter cerasinus]